MLIFWIIILIVLVVTLLDQRADKKQSDQLDREMEQIRADLARKERGES